MSATVHTRPARRADAGAIAEIHNHGIAGRLATFETEPRRVEDVAARIDGDPRHPQRVLVDAEDRVLGWAGLSAYRPRACYDGIAEFSIYLAPEARGRGLATQLLQSLIDAARACGHWKLVSRIFPANVASRALCRRCGFREVGVYEKHGRLDGRWLDVVIVERLIHENLVPADAAVTTA